VRASRSGVRRWRRLSEPRSAAGGPLELAEAVPIEDGPKVRDEGIRQAEGRRVVGKGNRLAASDSGREGRVGSDAAEGREDRLEVLPGVDRKVRVLFVGFEEQAALAVDEQGGVLQQLHEQQGVADISKDGANQASEIADGLVGVPESVQATRAVQAAGFGSIKLSGATIGVGHKESGCLAVSFGDRGEGVAVGGKEVEEAKGLFAGRRGGVDKFLNQPGEGPDPVAEGQGDVFRLQSDIFVKEDVGGIGNVKTALDRLAEVVRGGGTAIDRQIGDKVWTKDREGCLVLVGVPWKGLLGEEQLVTGNSPSCPAESFGLVG
jgi:hypothetical protein